MSNADLYEEIQDSLILDVLSILSLWGGVAIILGSNIIGSILSVAYGIISIIFVNNVWTTTIYEHD